uniref:Serine/threonine-protein phosphatase 7 long form homolog n=2 Tax=Nicotiana TaxID=4085 RepID=A0A1S3ZT86_TOBAC|nr:PREDICTED: serine/threonine-protein phosphatase 7 long form homolog [Nicotiana sylvestris]XP_016467626.1 PREDICTED: serine/threonine-protein phosphatase 7 long form homolog [Nicotiana tabacum]
MEVPPVHPGPASRELLLIQGHIWDGQRLSQTFSPNRIEDMWEFIRDHPLHPCIVRRLQGTSFYRIIEISRLKFKWALIIAMIEQWRPETHTFHLPIGEATIMLEDMEVLFGLPIDSIHVSYPHTLRDCTGEDYLHMLQRLIGFQTTKPTVLSGASRLQLTPVRQHLVAMDAKITDDSPPEDIDQHPILLLLMMFGGILFLNTSENLAYIGTQRVLHQFGCPQLVPIPLTWHMTHHQRDDRCRVD